MSSFGPIASVPQAGSARPSETFAGEHLVSAKVSRVIGTVRAKAIGRFSAHLRARVVGKVSAQIHFRQLEAYVQVPRIIGPVRAMAGRRLQAHARVRRVLGPVRAMAVGYANDWALAGFPLPDVEGYQYAANDSLVRTQMASGEWRQRRRWTGGYRTMTASVTVDREMLMEVEQFLNLKGEAWFTMGVVVGENPDGRAWPYLVRTSGDPEVSGMYGNTIRLSIQLEVAYRIG